MKHFHGTSHFRFDIDGMIGGGTTEPRSMRDILNAAYTSCMVIIRPLEQKKGKRTAAEFALWKKTSKRMGEAAEQLEILNWCDYMAELDAENLKAAIAEFDAETEQLKAEA